MGGDNAPDVVIEGAIAAVNRTPDELEVILVGREDQINACLEAGDGDLTTILPEGVSILHAEDVIEMAESPSVALKTKRNSSIHLGLGLLAKKEADAFVSAGNTGAVMAASVFVPGRIEGVSRPSIASYYPTAKGFCVVLDVGANVDCKPENLVQFAQMGKVFMERVHSRKNPTIALLNIGEEPGKGNELVKEAYKLLDAAPGLNFVGNMEGGDLMNHGADLVVCDGFVGNVVLKLGESVSSILVGMLQEEVAKLKLNWDERATVARVVGTVQKKFNYEEYGGAPLLGIKGNVLIGHGRASARAIERLIVAGANVAREKVSASISEAINSSQTAAS